MDDIDGSGSLLVTKAIAVPPDVLYQMEIL
jgi:hypothetical protein